MHKTITIKRNIFKIIFISIFAGFALLFGLEHFGDFSYVASSTNNSNDQLSFTSYIDNDTPVNSIYFESFFNNKVETRGNGFNAIDVHYKESEFHTYSNKLYYFIEATKLDYIYGAIFSIVIILTILFFQNIKIKFI